jgi:hypothetical protein
MAGLFLSGSFLKKKQAFFFKSIEDLAFGEKRERLLN